MEQTGERKGKREKERALAVSSHLELGNVGADNLLDLLAVLVKVEGGHGGDTSLAGGFRVGVNVHLVASDAGVLLSKCLAKEKKKGRNKKVSTTIGQEGRETHGTKEKMSSFTSRWRRAHLKLGANHLAGAAPRGGEVNGDLCVR